MWLFFRNIQLLLVGVLLKPLTLRTRFITDNGVFCRSKLSAFLKHVRRSLMFLACNCRIWKGLERNEHGFSEITLRLTELLKFHEMVWNFMKFQNRDRNEMKFQQISRPLKWNFISAKGTDRPLKYYFRERIDVEIGRFFLFFIILKFHFSLDSFRGTSRVRLMWFHFISVPILKFWSTDL
jgi:hypothetical protein